MSDTRIMILTPAHVPSDVPGAVQIDADCGHRAWISPSGLQAQLAMGMHTECIDCVSADKIAETGIEMAPGVREELDAIMGPMAAEQLIAEAHRDVKRFVKVQQVDSRRRKRGRRR